MDQDLERFRACARAYGAHARRWPEEDRPLFERYAGTPEGAAVLAAAERTDAFLDAWAPAADADALAERIVAAAIGEAPRRRRRMMWSAAAFAASALLGFAIGFAQAPPEPSVELVGQLLVGPSLPQGFGL